MAGMIACCHSFDEVAGEMDSENDYYWSWGGHTVAAEPHSSLFPPNPDLRKNHRMHRTLRNQRHLRPRLDLFPEIRGFFGVPDGFLPRGLWLELRGAFRRRL